MVRSIRQLDALREDWNALSARFRSPLLDHEWFLSCAEAFHRDDDLRLSVTTAAGELVGAAPLVRVATPTGPRVTPLGASRLYEPSGFLFSSAPALSALLDQVVRTGEPIILPRVPVDSPLCEMLHTVPSYRALTLCRSSTPSLAVSTRQKWEDYYRGLSRLVTRNLPRVRRKAEQALGRMHVQLIEPRVAEVDGLLETVIAVEGSGWKGHAGSAIGKRADMKDFFRRYCRRAAELRRLRVGLLSFGTRVAAVELSVEAYDRMWQLKIGYDEAVAPYYPGLLLTEASIRSAFERQLEAYEFLGSSAPWEERWRPDTRLYNRLAIYPLSARGVTGACCDLTRAVWRRLRRPAAG